MEADGLVLQGIADVIRSHSALVAIAIRQRAKFEGWLKFELAAYVESRGMQKVRVEAATEGSRGSRGDVTFYFGGERCDVELKTCNTNWRMQGVDNLTRPITKNVAGVVKDAKKLKHCTGQGIVAVCIFPVKRGDMQWVKYLERIAEEAGIPLSVNRHSTRVLIPLDDKCEADVVILSFLAKSGLSTIPAPSP